MSSNFPDLDRHWAKSCILALGDRHIVQGFPDGTFRPDTPLTRAEFAALMFVAFPNAPKVRDAVYFPDVSQTHWAYEAVIWGYERGLFSGYPEGYFYPDLLIARMQVMAVLVTALHLPKPPNFDETLTLYFDDAAEIPDWTRWAIAAAVSDNRLANHPNVRLFRPTQNATRGELAALLCLALEMPNAVPLSYATWSVNIYAIQGSVTVPYERWQGCARLMHDIQVILTDFRLYCGAIDGRYTSTTEAGLTTFCDFYGLNAMKVGAFDSKFAWALTSADPIAFILAQSQDRQQVYATYLMQEEGLDAEKLAFLDRGYPTSRYAADIPNFPDRLTQKPDGVTLVSPESAIAPDLYPARGEQPPMDAIGLDFLHPDIQQACVCVGSFAEGMIRARWLGKNALQSAQLWSATKILPLLNVLCRANAAHPEAQIRDCMVQPIDSSSGYGFYPLAVDLVSYQEVIGSSNAIAALFKQFSTPEDLQSWVQQITGNFDSDFLGRYGEPPLVESPELWSQPLATALLKASFSDHTGNNALSTYDLTRFISLVGWHNHLFPGAQLPNAQWHSLETAVRALSTDTARYIDVAIDQLGLAPAIESPVILSKLGFGRSDIRYQTELSYVAFVQLIDKRPRAKDKPAILHTIAMALLGANAEGDADLEARQLDARMAAEVTEILRRVLMQELV